jgi:hypothetical protein
VRFHIRRWNHIVRTTGVRGKRVPSDLSLLVFVLVVAAFLAGQQVERARARSASRAWRARRAANLSRFFRRRAAPRRSPKSRLPDESQDGRAHPPADSADQLRRVMSATFSKRRLLSRSEARVFFAAEKAIQNLGLSWRVMAQVSLGEVLASPDQAAFSAINSKRVDVLLVSGVGDPIAAIEYQGRGHYQGTASARDAVKREALRRAGVRYIEMTPEHGPKDLAREIARLIKAPAAAAESRSEPPGGHG